MGDAVVGRVLWRAVEDSDFRRRAIQNLGSALAEDGFILSDDEMRELRNCWEPIQALSERAAYERIMANARGYRRELRHK